MEQLYGGGLAGALHLAILAGILRDARQRKLTAEQPQAAQQRRRQE